MKDKEKFFHGKYSVYGDIVHVDIEFCIQCNKIKHHYLIVIPHNETINKLE